MVVIQVACSCAKRGEEPPAQPQPASVAEPAQPAARGLGAAKGAAEPAVEPAPAANAASAGAKCVMNLSYLSKALREYTKAHGGKLPQVASADELAKALAPYLRVDESASFTCPETGKPYQFNAALAGKRASSVGPELVLKDSVPHDSGDVNAVTVGGTLGSHAASDAALAKGTFR